MLWSTCTSCPGVVPCSGRRPWHHRSSPSLTASHPLWVSGPACLLRTQWSNSQEKRGTVCSDHRHHSLDKSGFMPSTWCRWALCVCVCLCVCLCVCVCDHTTLGSRLFCRSGKRVWVRMYTPEEKELNVLSEQRQRRGTVRPAERDLTHRVGGKVLLQPVSVQLSLVHHTPGVVYLSGKKQNWESQTEQLRRGGDYRGRGDTHQHVQGWILLLEGLCKLPHLACLWQVHNMDVNLLEIKKKTKKKKQLRITFSHQSWDLYHLVFPQHSLYSQTDWWCPLWPPLLYLCSCTPCGQSHLETKAQSFNFLISVRCVTPLRELIPFLAIVMAVALPIPLLAPVIIKDLPTTDTVRSWGSKSSDAASYPFLKARRKPNH